MSARDLFGKVIDQDWTFYKVQLQFRGVIVGGIPSDKSVIEGWIRARMDLGDAAITELVEQTVAERGTITPTEAVALVASSELAPSVNGFKRDPITGELCIEGRIVKAGIKEWTNSAYPGTKWPGQSKAGVRKGAMKHVAEIVFIEDDLIGLGVKEPARIEERIKHIQTPQGPRSTVNRVEVVERPCIEFTMKVRDDAVLSSMWPRIWAAGEEIGLGSDRARSDGRFYLEEFSII
jgi:hypothetical protein